MKSAEIKGLLREGVAGAPSKPQKAQLTKLKVQHAVSPVEDPSIIKKSRRDIARMLTILRQKNPKC